MDPVGYKPVFYTLASGYSKQVLDTARRVLAKLKEDPSDILGEIIETEADPKIKLLALGQVETSKAPSENKVAVAIRTLVVALTVDPKNMVERTSFRELRKKALSVLVSLDTLPPPGLFVSGAGRVYV